MKTSSKFPQIGFSMLLVALTALVPATLAYGLDQDGAALISPISANEIYGYLPGQELSFLVESGWVISPRASANGETYGKRMTKIEFYLGEKTLQVQVGGGELYVKGFHTNTGVLTKLTAHEKRLLREAYENSANVNLGEQTEVFLNTLDALSSWPRNMLVFVWHDDAKAISAVGDDRLATTTSSDFNARNTDAAKVSLLDRAALESLTPPALNMTATDVRESESVQSVTSICFAIGTKYTGRYFECDDFLCLDRTNHRYSHYVGGPSCFGRCGAACSGIPHGRKYTRDCFNHDACVKNLGSTAESCDIMFTFCFDDVIRAPNCP